MNRLRRQLTVTATIGVMVALWITESVVAVAVDKNGYDFPNSGVATVLSPSSLEIETKSDDEAELNIQDKFDAEENRMITELAMAKVNDALNVRADASENADIVGYLYRDCGGTIIEQKDGWTKVKSGALTGWCSNDYLLFEDEAVEMAHDVGRWLITVNSEAVRVRTEPDDNAEVLTVMSKADIGDYAELVNDDWIAVDFEGSLGYINTKYTEVTFHIDEGATKEQVETRLKIEEQFRKEAEAKAAKEAAAKKEAMRKENRGAVSANADEVRLLAALIYCEAGNQPYEGMVAVGAVVMNRVKSPAYPNTIYSVIYASGQFTPAMSGRVARVYESGPPANCVQAAQAAIAGETTVGDATHFRRNNGHPGIVIGAHVFW